MLNVRVHRLTINMSMAVPVGFLFAKVNDPSYVELTMFMSE